MNSGEKPWMLRRYRSSVFLTGNGSLVGIAEPGCRIQQVYCSTVCRSNVDRLITLSTSAVAVCCSATAQLVEQPRVLDGDNCLCGEFCSSSICFSVKGRTS